MQVCRYAGMYVFTMRNTAILGSGGLSFQIGSYELRVSYRAT